MRKHTRCCSLQTSTANPYSRRTSPLTVPNSATKGTRPMWPNFPTNSRVQAHWFLGSRSQTNLTIMNKSKHNYTLIHTCAHTQKYRTNLNKTQGPRNICHARPGKYYISGVRTVPQTLSDAQVDSNAERCARTRRIGKQDDQLNNLRATRREIWCHPARH